MSWIKERILNWFQSLVLRTINEVLKHMAFIMDDNRRYANKQILNKTEGHSKGYVFLKRICRHTGLVVHLSHTLYFIYDRLDKMIEILNWCVYFGIVEVTVYVCI